jgi:glycosyltransferase involved in cell wall biosynthesis
MVKNCPVSVIVPIYKVENFVERCARSLFEQTLENVEYIFVDDASPDRSMERLRRVMAQYACKDLAIKIITHEQNKGLPSARNSGLTVAAGEYVFHCDSDDWMERDALEKMYRAAQNKQADIVWCDWFLSFRNNERYMQQKGEETPLACVRAMLSGSMKYNVWNKLVKRSLYVEHAIRFPDGFGMGEDMTMIKLFAFAQKVVYVPTALYHYVQSNTSAFTKNASELHLSQVLHNATDTIEFIHSRYGGELEMEIQFFKLNIKLPFLISKETKSYRRWLELYPEANAYIGKNKMFSYRTRLIQRAAERRQFWIVRLYYYLVIKVVYGIIYK